MPEFGGWEGRIDMMPAEQAAQELCEAVVGEYSDKNDGAKFAHHECPISLEVAEMKRYVELERKQERYETMPGLKWVGQIKALGFGYLFASQEVSVRDADGSGSGSGSGGGTKLESRR
jgi:hybrid polyketide synthase/nonribosomal peptide synthetase ACE1